MTRDCPGCGERIEARLFVEEQDWWVAECSQAARGACNLDAHGTGPSADQAIENCYFEGIRELGHMCQDPDCGDYLDAPDGVCVSAAQHKRFVGTERKVAGVTFTQWVRR